MMHYGFTTDMVAQVCLSIKGGSLNVGSVKYGDIRMVKTIEPQDFDVELESNGEPFLVAFLKHNERFRIQSQALESASHNNADKVQCYLYDVDYLDTGMQRFMVKGTPTFLLFSGGREVDRLIGESDQETLAEFIRNSITDA